MDYAALARLVEVVGGRPFPDYLRAHVFALLAMTGTSSVVTAAQAPSAAPDVARGHLLAFGVPIAREELDGYLGGSGGVISSARDTANWLIAQNQGGTFRGRSLLSPRGIELRTLRPGVRHLLCHGLDAAASRPSHHRAQRGAVDLLRPAGALAHRTVRDRVPGQRLQRTDRLRRWAARRTGRPWRVAPGVAGPFAPAAVTLLVPTLVTRLSGRCSDGGCWSWRLPTCPGAWGWPPRWERPWAPPGRSRSCPMPGQGGGMI